MKRAFNHFQLLKNRKLERISFNLCKSRSLYLTDFKTKRENFKSNSITVIVLEKNSYLYLLFLRLKIALIKYELTRSNQKVI